MKVEDARQKLEEIVANSTVGGPVMVAADDDGKGGKGVRETKQSFYSERKLAAGWEDCAV